MSQSKLDTMIAQMSPAQRKHFAALLATMQATPAPVAAEPKARVRKPKLAKEHIIRRMATAKVATPKLYPYTDAAGNAYQSETLSMVAGAVKVVLSCMGKLWWYDAKGNPITDMVMDPKDLAALRAQYAHATSLPVWAK